MLEQLNSVIKLLPEYLESPDGWSSLVINRRKPTTMRASRNLLGLRVCLHHFEKCDPIDAFMHPHPWPAAFCILKGSYLMSLATSVDRTSKPPFEDPKILMVPGSRYEITNPLTWHSVTPVDDEGVWTIMVNDEPWPADIAHRDVRTTKGKDLDKMSPEQLDLLFAQVRALLL